MRIRGNENYKASDVDVNPWPNRARGAFSWRVAVDHAKLCGAARRCVPKWPAQMR